MWLYAGNKMFWLCIYTHSTSVLNSGRGIKKRLWRDWRVSKQWVRGGIYRGQLSSPLTQGDRQLFMLTFTQFWNHQLTCLSLECGRKLVHLVKTCTTLPSICIMILITFILIKALSEPRLIFSVFQHRWVYKVKREAALFYVIFKGSLVIF